MAEKDLLGTRPLARSQNPQARMQELLNQEREQSPTQTDAEGSKEASQPVTTETSPSRREDGLTERHQLGYTETSAEARVDGKTEGLTERRKDARKPVSPPVNKEASQPVKQYVRPSDVVDLTEDGFVDYLRVVIAARRELQGGSKTTVDMSQELTARARRYMADHRGVSMRQMFIEFMDAFLSVEGY